MRRLAPGGALRRERSCREPHRRQRHPRSARSASRRRDSSPRQSRPRSKRPEFVDGSETLRDPARRQERAVLGPRRTRLRTEYGAWASKRNRFSARTSGPRSRTRHARTDRLVRARDARGRRRVQTWPALRNLTLDPIRSTSAYAAACSRFFLAGAGGRSVWAPVGTPGFIGPVRDVPGYA